MGTNLATKKNREIFRKIEKRKSQHVSIILRDIVTKSHEEITIFNKTRGHLADLTVNFLHINRTL